MPTLIASRPAPVVKRSFDQMIVHGVSAGDWRYPPASSRSRAAFPFLLVYARFGALELGNGGADFHLRAGDLVLVHNVPPLRLHCSDERAAAVLLCLPESTVRPFADAFHEHADTVWSSSSGGTAGIVGGVLEALADDMDTYEPRSPGRLVHHLVGLLSVMCDDAPGPHSEVAADNIVASVKEYIETHLASHELTPDRAAAEHFVSTRTLHRLFGREGYTVAAWIRQRRLESCRIDLDDATYDAMPISAIGERWGLVDAPHFIRLFKSAYGCTPGQYRVMRRQLAANSQASSQPVDAHISPV